MKKLFAGILCAAVCGAAMFGAAACGGAAEGETTFEFAGSLQALYGEGGYPQAVLVVKNDILEDDPAAVAKMLIYMEGAHDYLAASEPTKVVSDLSVAYPATDFTPSFNAKNLNAQVIENCSVKFEAAAAAKASVKSYLAEVNFPAPADAFFYAGGAQEGTISGQYTVYAPDGAPALALAGAIADGNTHFAYHIVNANGIVTTVTGEEAAKNADFCILPSNAAAQKLGTAEKYTMLGVVTHGNMYFLRANTLLPDLTAENLSALVGKKVGVVQLENVPGLTFKAVLTKAGIPFSVLNSEGQVAADKVNLVSYADATTVGPAGGCDYYLCPEPAATLKVNNFKAQNK